VANPLVSLSTLSRPPVAMTNAVTMLTGFGLLGAFTLIPQIVQAPESTGYGFAATATRAGLVLVPGALVMLVVGPASGWMGGRFGGKVPLAAGGVMTSIGLFLLAELHGSELEILINGAVMFAGLGLTYAAMPNLIVEAVPGSETGEATAFNAVMRLIGASVGAQVCASILAGSADGPGAFPTDGAFKTAFFFSGTVALIAAALALLIPKVEGEHAQHLSALEEVGAASPLAESLYGTD